MNWHLEHKLNFAVIPGHHLESLKRQKLSLHIGPSSSAQLLQSCPTLGDPINGDQPGSSVPGILQARILEWVAMPSSRGSSWPRDQTQVSYISFMWNILICSGLIHVSGRSSGKGNAYSPQYSYLENLMDRGAWRTTVHGVTKSWTRMSN